ncbi:MAG: hypothetical protein HAW67_02250 [Endozoicomonadaceae bacterium]|nr:hypothetical protein [Endozoicomonadaceae bacterium]
MKIFIVALLILTAFDLHAESVKVISYVQCHKMIKTMSFNVKPMACGNTQGKSSISFALLADNIVSIDKTSFKLHSLMYKGKSIKQNDWGVDTYKLNAFPDISDNNKYGTFSIEIEPPEFPSVQQISGKAELDYYIATSKKTLIKTVDTSKPYSFKVGDVIVTNMDKGNHDKNGLLINVFKDLLVGNSETSIFVNALGDRKQISNLVVEVKGHKIQSQGVSTFNEQSSYSFSKPQASEVVIKIDYWEGFTKKNAMFSF